MKRILVVEDECAIRSLLFNVLTDAGYDVDCLSCGSDKVLSAYDLSYDLVVSDVHLLSGESGIENIELSRVYGSEVAVLFISGIDYSDRVDHFIPKPFKFSVLLDKISDMLREE